MGKVTNDMIHLSYELGKKYYSGKITKEKGVLELVNIGTNPTTGSFLMEMYKNHVQVTEFKRAMNGYGTEYFLKRLFEEKGNSGLYIALQSLKLNLKYHEKFNKGKRKKGWKIYNHYKTILLQEEDNVPYPDEESQDGKFTEGKVLNVSVNKLERNHKTRKICLDHYGHNCQVCNFNFEEHFGEIGKDFIRVHHLLELSEIREEYEVNPLQDLVPVCPNYHAMLHKRKPAFSISELKSMLNKVV